MGCAMISVSGICVRRGPSRAPRLEPNKEYWGDTLIVSVRRHQSTPNNLSEGSLPLAESCKTLGSVSMSVTTYFRFILYFLKVETKSSFISKYSRPDSTENVRLSAYLEYSQMNFVTSSRASATMNFKIASSSPQDAPGSPKLWLSCR